jgi:hypothetical protein
VALLGVGSAQAIQFTPPSTARLHTITSGEAGAEWNTSGLGAGGQISYDSGTGILTMTGVLDTLNYFDPSNGTCSTDVGSNCAVNFGPDLDITLSAAFDSLVVNPVVGTIVEIVTSFGTSAGVDVVVTDPSDATVVFRGDFKAGTFGSTPTTGLSTSVFYDTSTGLVIGAPPVNAIGFIEVDQTSLYADLSLPDFFLIEFGSIDDFDDGIGAPGTSKAELEAILAASIVAGSLVDFTAEGNGQVYRTASGEFVPEAGTLLTLGSGVLGLALFGRRRLRDGERA